MNSLVQNGERVYPLEIEVSSDVSVNQAIELVGKKHGPTDVLINSVGITNQKPTQDIATADWQQLIDVHLGETFRCSLASFPYLRATGNAKIVNVSSIAGRMGMPIGVSYCAAKAGIERFTCSLATEWVQNMESA